MDFLPLDSPSSSAFLRLSPSSLSSIRSGSLILEVVFFAEMSNTDESSSLLLYTEMLSCAVIDGTGKLDA